MMDIGQIAGPGVAGLLFLAAVNTMPEALPAPLSKVAFFAWLYAWLHDALKTFVSFRGPKSGPLPTVATAGATGPMGAPGPAGPLAEVK